jgi:hypothetical protein
MSRKQILIILGIIFFLLFGLLLYAYLLSKTPVSNEDNFFEKGVREFSPFGNVEKKPITTKTEPVTNEPTENEPDTATTTTTQNTDFFPRLRKISTEPVSGSTIIDRKREVIRDRVKQTISEEFIRYMDRATGHIFETKTNALPVNKISNTTIPKVYEALFNQAGERVIVRGLQDDTDVITTFNLFLKNPPVTTSTSSATSTITKTVVRELQGVNLGNNIKEVVLNPLKTKALTLTYKDDGGVFDIITIADNKKRTVFSYPLREWLLSIPNETKAVINTKPSGFTDGFAYFLDLQNGSIEKITGGILGLTISVSPKLDYALIGSGGTSIQTEILDIKKKEINPVAIYTLPEKCVWSTKQNEIAYCAVPTVVQNATYPDNWYQGQISFNDQIWKINAKTGSAEFIIFPEKYAGESVDGINLEVSPDDSYLTFMNKKDLSLWGLILKEEVISNNVSSSTNQVGTSTPQKNTN